MQYRRNQNTDGAELRFVHEICVPTRLQLLNNLPSYINDSLKEDLLVLSNSFECNSHHLAEYRNEALLRMNLFGFASLSNRDFASPQSLSIKTSMSLSFRDSEINLLVIIAQFASTRSHKSAIGLDKSVYFSISAFVCKCTIIESSSEPMLSSVCMIVSASAILPLT